MDQGAPQGLMGKHILLGITGGIAAYKTPDLVRKLTAAGAEVCAVTTEGAKQFVSTTALQAVSGRPVRDSLWDEAAEAAMGHIELARWADLVLIAPATANCLAKLAQGTADDLLSTLCLATTAPLVVAPAMNVRMWQHPATEANITTLQSRGTLFLGPADGAQACGEYGPGRMLEPEEICSALANLTLPASASKEDSSSSMRMHDELKQDIQGLMQDIHVVLTAGPTREALDPVRYLSNRSSGKQGYAIAEQAARLGAKVTLISGPTTLDVPPGVERVDVVSALDMLAAVEAVLPQADLFIGVAAVADYRVNEIAGQKIKKTPGSDEGLALNLVPNPDIIATVAATPNGPVTIGFAAETQKGLENARGKLKRKGLDLIALNDVSDQRIGFRSNDNALTLIWSEGEQQVPMQDKSAIAKVLLSTVVELFGARLKAPAKNAMS